MPHDLFEVLDNFLTLLAVFVPTPSFGGEKLRELPLSEMVSRADIVILGKVMRIEKSVTPGRPAESVFDEVGVATVDIEQVIIGSYEGKEIDITYYPRLTFEGHFGIDERCILFLMGQRNVVVHGCAGKIPIERDSAEVRYILGEPTRQTMKAFIERIRTLKSPQEQVRD